MANVNFGALNCNKILCNIISVITKKKKHFKSNRSNCTSQASHRTDRKILSSTFVVPVLSGIARPDLGVKM